MEDKLLDPLFAECIGLWLAEGDNKTTSEITFTNNCLDLINLFYNVINKNFSHYHYNPRIYVYSKNKEEIKIPYENCIVKYYVHKRATKPFFILRFASVRMIKEWKDFVNKILQKKEVYPYILRGFFAGEGNIKEGSHSLRVLRIAQGRQKDFIDNLLNELNIKYLFRPNERAYVISGKLNWNIFAKYTLADLHPDKKRKFWQVYNSFKQEHYPTNHLIREVLEILENPKTTRYLSSYFNRSFARIQDVLIILKKQDKINNFRVRNVDYWIKNGDLIIISKIKKEYLLFLSRPKKTSDFAKNFKVCWKSSFKRLRELEKLGLVIREDNGNWKRVKTKRKIFVI